MYLRRATLLFFNINFKKSFAKTHELSLLLSTFLNPFFLCFLVRIVFNGYHTFISPWYFMFFMSILSSSIILGFCNLFICLIHFDHTSSFDVVKCWSCFYSYFFSSLQSPIHIQAVQINNAQYIQTHFHISICSKLLMACPQTLKKKPGTHHILMLCNNYTYWKLKITCAIFWCIVIVKTKTTNILCLCSSTMWIPHFY
jgi:hypothetical protein